MIQILDERFIFPVRTEPASFEQAIKPNRKQVYYKNENYQTYCNLNHYQLDLVTRALKLKLIKGIKKLEQIY